MRSRSANGLDRTVRSNDPRESKELVILGLSLANWSLLSFLGFTVVVSALALAAYRRATRGQA